MYAFVDAIPSLTHFVLLVIISVQQASLNNYKELTTIGLLEQFTAKHDMALIKNCPEIQVRARTSKRLPKPSQSHHQPRPFLLNNSYKTHLL